MIDDARIKAMFLQSSSEYNKSFGSFINASQSREINHVNENEINDSSDIERCLNFGNIRMSNKRKHETDNIIH